MRVSLKTMQMSVRMFLTLVSVMFFVWIFNANVPIAGIKKITYIFGRASGMVTQLRPMARLGESGTYGGISYQKILEDPVYFDIRTPVEYEMLSIKMLYKNHTARQIGMGIREFPTQMNFLFTPFRKVETRGDWTLGRADIPLRDIRRMVGKYSLSLSVPGLEYHPDSEEYVLVSRMDIRLERPSLIPFSQK